MKIFLFLFFHTLVLLIGVYGITGQPIADAKWYSNLTMRSFPTTCDNSLKNLRHLQNSNYVMFPDDQDELVQLLECLTRRIFYERNQIEEYYKRLVVLEEIVTNSSMNDGSWMIGPPGPVGPMGDTGSTGSIGVIGLPGASGAAGMPGSTGSIGAPGADGDSGSSGSQGGTGAIGNTGQSGSAGASGAAGASGWAGSAGDTGASGSPGASGAPGALGPQGATGAPG